MDQESIYIKPVENPSIMLLISLPPALSFNLETWTNKAWCASHLPTLISCGVLKSISWETSLLQQFHRKLFIMHSY